MYVPANGTYGKTFTFSYQVTSTNSSLTSNTATTTARVMRVYKAPTYSGVTAVSIPENSEANILFSAFSEAGFYSVAIINTPSSGSLLFVSENGSLVNITGLAPYTLNNSNAENRVKYTPPTNTSSENLVSITVQVVDIYGVSTPVTIYISVYHINVAPSVVPTTYSTVTGVSSWTNIVTMPENECATISWDLYDFDSPRSNLSSLIASLPFRGELYQLLADGSKGNVIPTQGVILPSSDGFFHAIYCPDLGKSGNNFASFSIIGSDNIAVSARHYVNLRVIHTNVAPTVNITQREWNTSISQDTIITGTQSFRFVYYYYTLPTLLCRNLSGRCRRQDLQCEARADPDLRQWIRATGRGRHQVGALRVR